MNRLTIFLFVFWFGSVCNYANSFTLDKPILYTGKEPGLTLVDNKSLQSTIHNRSQLIMFEFYNSWCGHCVRFAPIWKQLASDVRRWNSTVLLTALDCAEDSNSEICRDYEVMMYPSIRFFYPFVNNTNEHGTQLEELKPDAVYLKGLIMKSLIDYQANHSTPTWPNLQPIANLTEWHRIREATYSSQNKIDSHLFAIIESSTSMLGTEVCVLYCNQRLKLKFAFFTNMMTDNFGTFQLRRLCSYVSNFKQQHKATCFFDSGRRSNFQCIVDCI